MGSMSEMNARIMELIECEKQIESFGWGTIPALKFELRWEESHTELNRYFSPLEIRRLIGELS